MRSAIAPLLALSFIPFAAPSALAARDRPEVGDFTGRPGQSEPSVTVPSGFLLVNGGLALSRSGGEGLLDLADTSWTVPDVLVRAGVHDILELRAGFGINAVRRRDGISAVQLELGGPVVGVTAALLPEAQWWPAVALISTVALPGATLDALDLAGELRLSATKGIGSFGVTTNLAGGWDNGSGQAFGNYTLAGTWALPAGVGLFVETYGGMDVAPNPSLPSLGFDGGVSVAVSPQLAVDLYAGSVLIGEPSVFFAIGGSWMPG